MCELCTEAETHILLAEAEQEIVLAEADDGESIPGAVRPLSAKERAAKVRFGDIDTAEQRAIRKAETVLQSLRGTIAASILGGLLSGNETVDPATAVARLQAMTQNQPRAVRESVNKAVTALETILGLSFTDAASIVRAEAKRQDAGTIPGKLPDPDGGLFTASALLVATQPWQRVTSRLHTTLLDPRNLFGPSFSRAMVLDNLENIPLDGAVDLARQTIHQAHGAGRNATVDLMEPTDSFSSELMDGATCSECATIDGRDFETLEEARAAYPSGGYVRCQGGNRCRGTLVFLFAGGTSNSSPIGVKPTQTVTKPKPQPTRPEKIDPVPIPKSPETPLTTLTPKSTPGYIDGKPNNLPSPKNPTQGEKFAINDYTRQSGVNYKLNQRRTLDNQDAAKVEMLDNLLAKTPLQQPVRVQRSARLEEFGISNDRTLNESERFAAMNALVGETLGKNQGFLSTSAIKDDGPLLGHGEFAINLHVPAGTPASFLKEYALERFQSEDEMLLPRGISYKITNAYELQHPLDPRYKRVWVDAEVVWDGNPPLEKG